MEDNTLRMVQLHTFISEENERMISKLQGKIQMEKGQRISKAVIINQALNDYLHYALEKEHDGK